MKKVLLLSMAVMLFWTTASFAQNSISAVPDTIRTSGHYTVIAETLLVDTTGIGDINAAAPAVAAACNGKSIEYGAGCFIAG